jgi:hypothetical protein
MPTFAVPASIKSLARSAANQVVQLLSGTASDAEGSQDLSYGFLLLGCSLSVDAGVGNGHTAQLGANVNGQLWRAVQDRLTFDAGANEPLIGQFLTIVADVSKGPLSPTPPPSPLISVTLFQRSPRAPGKRVALETLNVTGTFDANNLCRLNIPILLK